MKKLGVSATRAFPGSASEAKAAAKSAPASLELAS
jgi:hypothetical protein